MITIVNYEMGNVGSIQNMFKKIGHESIITSSITEIENATKLILPGVGAYDHAMENLHNKNLVEILKQKAIANTPLLGICLGMQLLGNTSEEGTAQGLGLINGVVKKFDENLNIKIPHMGWNTIHYQKENKLFAHFEEFGEARFYFVHSYYYECEQKEHSIATTKHGNSFTSAINKNNIYGVQFHPEKSHKYGLQLLKNFAEKI